MNLQYYRCHDNAQPPTNEHPSAGWDFYCVSDETFSDGFGPKLGRMLHPGDSHIFHTGIKASFTPGHVGIFMDRSGMGAKRKIHCMGAVLETDGLHRLAGVIDSDYRGEWMVSLINLGHMDQIIWAGDKIIQCVFHRIPSVNLEEAFSQDQLDWTMRGEKGFGSSGQ